VTSRLNLVFCATLTRVSRDNAPALTKRIILSVTSQIFDLLGLIGPVIIKYTHEQQLHAGPQGTLAALRQKYWIVSPRSVIRQVLHQCHKCFKAKPVAAKFKIGNLPNHRVQPARPFATTGVDYAGPFYIREIRGGGKKLYKAYTVHFF
jgi:hypothetical protein